MRFLILFNILTHSDLKAIYSIYLSIIIIFRYYLDHLEQS